MTGSQPQHVVVMGVAASGKTTIATRLAARLQHAFADADDFHPAANVAKMARGEALSDADREPWLRTVAAWIATQHEAGRSSVLACSALKRRYRDVLRTPAPQQSLFVHLAAPRDALLRRMLHRSGHFMPATLLDSQLAALEPLQSDEVGITLDATESTDAILARTLAFIAETVP